MGHLAAVLTWLPTLVDMKDEAVARSWQECTALPALAAHQAALAAQATAGLAGPRLRAASTLGMLQLAACVTHHLRLSRSQQYHDPDSLARQVLDATTLAEVSMSQMKNWPPTERHLAATVCLRMVASLAGLLSGAYLPAAQSAAHVTARSSSATKAWPLSICCMLIEFTNLLSVASSPPPRESVPEAAQVRWSTSLRHARRRARAVVRHT